MKTQTPSPLTPAQREALEARFALRVTARLEEGALAVPHDISERLRVAREQAVQAAREARLGATAVAPLAAPVIVGSALVGMQTAGGSMGGAVGSWQESSSARATGHGRQLDDNPTGWGWRLAAVLPVVALVAGLWAINRYHQREQVEATTDVDMALLTDDLPPAAYADPGFAEFLDNDSGPTVRPIEEAPPEADGDLSTTDTTPAAQTP